MNRRTFLRTAGLLGGAGMAGCATPFGPVSPPEHADGSGSDEGETQTPELTPTPEPPETRSGTALAGVYPGGPESNLVSNLSLFGDWLSENPAMAMVFVDAFGPRAAKVGFVEEVMTDIWNTGSVPLVTWQPFLRQKQQTPEVIERQIAQGKYDAQIETWAQLLSAWSRPRGEKTRGRRFYFRPAHEMNGNWFPWSAVDSSRIDTNVGESESTDAPGPDPTAGTPEDYVEMWRRIHDIFSNTEMDETNIQWMWAPNVDEIGGVRTERYYPGDQYVDWVGLDGFNFGGTQIYSDWRTPEELFSPMLNRMRELTSKPIALTEFASTSFVPANDGDGNETDGQYQPQRKAEWIEAVFEYVIQNNIKMTCWFNQDKTGGDEADWAVFGSSHGTSQTTIDDERYRVYDAYKQTATGPEFLHALSEYPPLLTDAEFAGQF